MWSEITEAPGVDVIQLSSTEAATLQFDETLNSIIKQVEGLLKVERGFLFLKDLVTNELVFQLALGDKADQVKPFRVPLGQGLAGQVALTRQPLLKTNEDQNTRHALGAPLLLRGQVMGVLEVIRKDSFTRSEVEWLSSLAAYAAIAIENAYLHQNVLSERKRVLEVEEQTRKRLAHGLHDGPSQLISAVLMHLDCCLLLLEKDSTKIAEEIVATKELVEQVAHQIRTLLFELRPLALEAQGLQAALQIFLERRQKNILRNTRLAFEVETLNSDGAISRQDSKVEAAIFAIVQEAVNNALKYALADNIVVQLKETVDALHVIIVDDGQGFEVAEVMDSYEQGVSLGLLTIQERTELIGGELTINSAPDQGTRLTVWVPKIAEARRQKHSTTERLSLPVETISGKGILENTEDHAKMDEILTVQEVAHYLKVSRSTVWRWCNEGRMSAFKVGHGWRVHRSEVERIVGKEVGKISEIESKNNGR